MAQVNSMVSQIAITGFCEVGKALMQEKKPSLKFIITSYEHE